MKPCDSHSNCRRVASTNIIHSSLMELIKLFLIVLLLLTNVFCEEMDADNWREDFEGNKLPNSEEIQDILFRMTRKPGHRQYLGLMGKKDSAKSQTARKRHRFQTFVGLMGKRGFQNSD
ncbi:protachykinin [Centropristis striata]|uniref:protachykinin n=1 Tax=Centropristis striata TaxID=184440 RepID=UPI0027E0BF28|nr:protachykinin [Centropristis striata]